MAPDSSDSEVVQQQFNPGHCNPYIVVPENVAKLKDKDPNELTPLYARVDEALEDIFSDPPNPDTELQVAFRYEGYRIIVHHDGRTEFKKA